MNTSKKKRRLRETYFFKAIIYKAKTSLFEKTVKKYKERESKNLFKFKNKKRID